MDKFGSAEEVCLDRLGSCSEIDLREFTLQKVKNVNFMLLIQFF